MNILQRIKYKNRQEQFKPGLFSIVFNPYYFNRRAIYKGIKKHAKKLNGHLLDFGCGTKPYEDLFNVDKYVGLDIEENEGHNLPLDKIDVFYDGVRIPFSTDTFNSIYSSEVFEHIFNLNEILLEINRVHKKGGLMLITMPFVWQEHEMPNDFGRYTSSGIKSILKECNYEIIEHSVQPSFFLTIVQMLAAYIYNAILPKYKVLKFLLMPITIFPVNLFGLFFSFILPEKKELFINHIILAKNIKKTK